MSIPGAASPAASTTLVLALLLPVAASADDHSYRTLALAGTYRYDATIPPPPPEPAPVAVEPAGRAQKRVANPAERIASETPGLTSAPVGSATIAPDGTLLLPKMTVPGARGKLPATLPQFYLRSPVRNVGKGNAFETPAGRRARLINKYYTPAEQRLAKVFFNSLGASAERNEATAQLNDLAYLIELSLAAGTETPEEQQKIRAEYYQLLGPK